MKKAKREHVLRESEKRKRLGEGVEGKAEISGGFAVLSITKSIHNFLRTEYR